MRFIENLPDGLFERTDGAVCYVGTGVKFHIFVNAYNLDHSPESLADMFETLELEDVLKLIDIYLENQTTADEFVVNCNRGRDEEMKRLRDWQASPGFQTRRRAHIEQKKRDGSPPYETADRDVVVTSA